MKIKFIRNTHDENSEYRGDGYFTNQKGEVFDNLSSPLSYTGVHAFDRLAPLSFDEYYVTLLKQAIGGAYHPKPPIIDLRLAILDLALLLEYKLVKAVTEEDLDNLKSRADEKSAFLI